MAFEQSGAITVKRIKGKGRGVVARRPIKRGEVIERVPVLVLPAEVLGTEEAPSPLYHYCFEWSEGVVGLALGYGSIYNHSYHPNARYDDEGFRAKVFTALRDIAPGEEITVNYNGEPDDASPVWFTVVDVPGPAPARPRRQRQGGPSPSPGGRRRSSSK